MACLEDFFLLFFLGLRDKLYFYLVDSSLVFNFCLYGLGFSNIAIIISKKTQFR